MQLVRTFALSALSVVLLNATVLKEQELQKIQKQKEKSSLEADVTKESWINPLTIESDFTRYEKDKTKTHTKKVYINFNQDIFRSGGIFYTIQKAKLQKEQSLANYEQSMVSQNVEASILALKLQKIDVQIEQQKFLIENKTLEIEKKQAQYLNALIDIEELDSAVIEKNDLLNQREEFVIQKASLVKSFKDLSGMDYTAFKAHTLEVMSVDSYLQRNTTLLLQQLQSKIDKKDLQIENSSYLPKVSIYTQYGFERASDEAHYGDYTNSGIKVSIPLDFSMNEKRQIKQINYQLSQLEHNLKQEQETNQYNYLLTAIDAVKNKISNAQTTIKSYEHILTLTKDLFEGELKTKQDLQTIENRLASSRLDVKLFELDQQIYTYELFKHIRQ